MQNFSKNKSGFTIIEIMLSLAIFFLIVMAMTLFAKNIWTYGDYIADGLADANNGREAIKTMVAQIRQADTANTGAYVISLASSTAFTFYSDIYNTGLEDEVRYFLSGSTLEEGVTVPTGSPLAYNPANEKISTLISNVNNSTIFNYYDENYDGSEAALTSPINIPSIRLIQITVSIDQNPNRAPVTSTFSSEVSIRNLKDNL